MRLLVFGQKGQVATAFNALASGFKDLELLCLGRDKCDITKQAQVVKALSGFQPDLIVNAAGYTAVDLAEDDVETAYLVNNTALQYIAKSATCPVIHLSTDYVFNGKSDVPYEESHPIDPLGVYGGSKWAGEETLRTYCEQHLIFRTAWVYSPFGNNFVKTMRRLMMEREQISVVKDQIGCPTSALDIAEAILKIAPRVINSDFYKFGTYNLVSDTPVNWFEFAREIQNQSGLACDVLPILSSEYPTKAERPAYSVLSMQKFKDNFGFGLPDWKNSLSKCLAILDKAGE